MSSNKEKDLDKKDFTEETVVTEEDKENKESTEEFKKEEYINNYVEHIDDEEYIDEDEELELDDEPSFFKTLFASILDQAILLGVSAILLVIFDIVIGFIGFMVADTSAVLLIIFVIVNIIYATVLSRKNIRGLGKRILGIA